MTEPTSVPTSFVSRIGLAVVRPRWALAIAGGRRHPGRSGSDLLKMLMLVLVATQLRGLVGALWIVAVVDGTLGVQAAVRVMTGSLTITLASLVIAALVLYAAGGKRRDLGRSFDLACVAALPLLFVDLVATTAIRTVDLELPVIASFALRAISFAWTGALLVLASRTARTGTEPPTAPELVATGRKAGWGVMAVVAIGLVLAGIWAVRNLDVMRPVTANSPAPALALPRIADAKGTLGPKHALSDSLGRIVVIDFWATWCKPCLAQMPALEGLARQQDVDVIAINLDDPGHAFSMFDTAGFRDLILVADDGEVSVRYGVSSIPHTVIVDQSGMVRGVYRGGHDVAASVDAIRK